MGVRTIGTGGDYSTVAAWEADIGIGDPTGPWIGLLLAQTHGVSNTLSISAPVVTTPSEYIRLTAAPGAAHVGVAANTGLSGKAHAIISKNSGGTPSLPVISILMAYVEIDHVEIVSATNLTGGDFIALSSAIPVDNLIRLHHLLIHHDGQSVNSGNDGIMVIANSNPRMEIYRNIVYGLGGRAFNLVGNHTVAGSKIHNNTVFACNRANSASVVQYTLPNAACDVFNNIGFLPGAGRSFPETIPFSVLRGKNASDLVADPLSTTFEDYKNLSMWDHLENSTVVWTSTNCRLKKTSSLRDLGEQISSSSGSIYAEGIRGNPVSGRWDIGADEFPSEDESRARAVSRPRMRRPSAERPWKVRTAGATI